MSFVQPINRENDLIAVLENYEEKIDHFYWFVDALQKDGIQNSWDARINKNGKDWSCKIYYQKLSTGMDIVGIEDSGTYGLTGVIPQNAEDVVSAIRTEDSNERLCYFSSSYWSRKATSAIGSRGRGKLVFIGASEESKIYFDSLRSSDSKYIFGTSYLDENKQIQTDVKEGEEAELERKKLFGNEIKPLSKFGTRVIIPSPKEQIKNSFEFEKINEFIQHTWWEILYKFNADISVENDGWLTKISSSPWLPFNSEDSTKTEDYPDIKLNQDSYKIKKMSFTYLGEKEIPELYEGISIQRSGMSVQHLDVSQLIGDQIGKKIIGYVELDEKLEAEMRLNEGPEHFSIMWNRIIPTQLKNVIKSKALEFAKKYNLIENEENGANNNQRKAEITIQKELNNIARQLGYSGIGQQTKKRKKHPRASDDPIRISVPDFETPSPTGRVNYGEFIKGAYAIPINATGESIKTLIKVSIEHNDNIFKLSNKELLFEEEVLLNEKTDIKIGWDKLEITDLFAPGQYYLISKMIAIETKKINKEISFQKGDEMYRTVSRTFYVEEEPKDTGAFRLQRAESNDKNKYFWWEPEGNSWTIYWNGKHPAIQKVADDEETLQAELRRISYLIAIAIFCSDDEILNEENKKPKFFTKDELDDSNFDDLLLSIFRKESKLIWDKFK